MIEIIYGCGIIASLFIIYWSMRYPHEFEELLLLRNMRSRTDYIAAISIWYLMAFVALMILVAGDALIT